MAKAYREGSGWAFRLRIKGEDVYRGGFLSEQEARKALEALSQVLKAEGRPAHAGPWRTTLAEALQRYAVERLPAMKGARQDRDRINRYLRAAGLAIIRVEAVEGGGSVLWRVILVPPEAQRRIPQGLGGHREKQARRTAATDRQRKRLAQMSVAEIEPHEIQQLVDRMSADGDKAATVGLERAMLRRVFNYAKASWNWREPARNPATRLKMPKIDNGRDRILTNGEWRRISAALGHCLNPVVAPALALLLETTMRSSEALVRATWGDFDAEQCLLHLRDAKAGKRDVPLNPPAMAVLRQLHAQATVAGPVDPRARILPISYCALKAAWYRACRRAGVEGVHLHDLRHTGATRFSLELNGNMPVLKVITGHKTDSQLLRYLNIKAEDVVRLMHGRPLDEDNAPAGLRLVKAQIVRPGPADLVWDESELPTNVVPFVRRAGGMQTP